MTEQTPKEDIQREMFIFSNMSEEEVDDFFQMLDKDKEEKKKAERQRRKV